MSKTAHRCITAALLICAAAVRGQTPAPVSAPDGVTWYVTTGFAPYHILSGPEQGKGVMDKALKLLSDAMPQYRHTLVEAALPRTIDSLKNRTNACSLSLYKTAEREQFMEFSQPYVYLLPNGVVGLRKNAALVKPFLDERGEIRLDDMLGDSKLKLAIARERSYGASVDPIIKKHADNTVPVAATDTFSSLLLKLANHHEFDAMVGYAVELRYTTRDLSLDPNDFVVFPVAESPAVLPLAISCSKTDAGRKILASVDRVLADKATQQKIDGFYREWLDEASATYYVRALQQARGGK